MIWMGTDGATENMKDKDVVEVEILEALQCVVAPMGALAFRRGLQALSAEMGW